MSKRHPCEAIDQLAATIPFQCPAFCDIFGELKHEASISFCFNRGVKWNAAKEKFMDDKEANALLTRKYRKGWDWV